MAWFPCNIGGGGGPSGIANILKGISDPASSIGDNGQLYLKYADLSLREYIEVGSTAGPYINTGFYWSSDCEFEIKAKWTGTPANNTAFFGAYSPNQDTDVQVYNGNTLFYVGGGGTASLSIDTNDHIYKATQSELLLDGTNVSTPNWSRVPTSLEVSIFTMQQHSPAINARIYYIKIWKNGELHKYFIPAINNATNEIGMFEAVSGEFYSNDGTGNFDISQTVISDMPSQPILSSYAKVNGQWQSLIGTNIDDIQTGGGSPVVFKNYAKFNGTQGIILPFTINGDYKVTVCFYETNYSNDSAVIGNTYGESFSHLTEYSDSWYTSFGTGEQNFGSWVGNVEHTYITNNGNNKNEFDGVEVTNYTPTTSDAAYTIGCRGQYSNLYNGYIKSYKIESISTGDAVCELKPCLYNNETPCLYDTVNKKFYYANGLTVMDTIPTT